MCGTESIRPHDGRTLFAFEQVATPNYPGARYRAWAASCPDARSTVGDRISRAQGTRDPWLVHHVARHGDFTVEPAAFKRTADESDQLSEHRNALFFIGPADGTSGNSSATPGWMSARRFNALLHGPLHLQQRYDEVRCTAARAPCSRQILKMTKQASRSSRLEQRRR